MNYNAKFCKEPKDNNGQRVRKRPNKKQDNFLKKLVKNTKEGRISLPPVYLSQSLPDCKNPNRKCENEANKQVPLRRSKRVHYKKLKLTEFDNLAQYYNNAQKKCSEEDHVEPIVQVCNCNSLFEEINRKFNVTMAVAKKSQKADQSSDENFCMNLKNQMRNVTLPQVKDEIVQKIKSYVTQINAVLDGKEQEPLNNSINSRKSKEKSQNNKAICIIPKNEWVYKTPNDKKWKNLDVTPGYNTHLMPALLKDDGNSKILIELNSVPADTGFHYYDSSLNTAHQNHFQNIFDHCKAPQIFPQAERPYQRPKSPLLNQQPFNNFEAPDNALPFTGFMKDSSLNLFANNLF